MWIFYPKRALHRFSDIRERSPCVINKIMSQTLLLLQSIQIKFNTPVMYSANDFFKLRKKYQ